MKYKIEISYHTDDSFSSHDTTDVLELEWNNLDVSKKNLKAIQEHYEFYQKLNGWRLNSLDRQGFCKEVSDKEWFVLNEREIDGEKQYDSGSCGRQMYLEADNGNKMQLHCFWTGYFEQLQGAEILVDESDMKFEVK